MHPNGNPSRRTKTKGKPGIYHRDVREGSRSRRRYEITFLDSDGTRRWKTIPGLDNLDDAEAMLVAVKGKLIKGERVAPSKLTFAELADEWLAQLLVGERTYERYESNLRLYLQPRFGRRRAQDLTVDDVARLIADLHADGKAGWTINNVLTTLSSLMSWAVRRGMVPVNPVRLLERAERPKVARKRQCVFEHEEIGRLIDAAPTTYRPLIATALFSGLRLMELIGLRWQDVDFDNGYIHVRNQLGRRGKLKSLKSDAAERDVVLFPELASLLRRHKAASRFSQPHHFVFASTTGTPLNWRNAETRGFDKAITNAGLTEGRDSKPVMHDCRHTFASLLIALGLDVVFISRQLGHSTPATTLRIYTHLFDRANHAAGMRQSLSAQFGRLLSGNAVETTSRNGTKHDIPEMAQPSAASG
jgi:integrase